jgi:hypothetical protein
MGTEYSVEITEMLNETCGPFPQASQSHWRWLLLSIESQAKVEVASGIKARVNISGLSAVSAVSPARLREPSLPFCYSLSFRDCLLKLLCQFYCVPDGRCIRLDVVKITPRCNSLFRDSLSPTGIFANIISASSGQVLSEVPTPWSVQLRSRSLRRYGTTCG